VTRAFFVGRDQELAAAREEVERACSAEGGLVVLSGEAGIGKTRLAAEIAGLAAERGARVAWGRCWEAGGAPAYWPWLQALHALGDSDDPFAASETGSAIDAQQIRFQQFERAASFLKRAAAESALAIVLDDLHAADVPSLLLLQFIARDLRGTRLLVIATHRESEARATPEVAQLLAKISREGRALRLGRLGAEDVAVWVQEVSPAADASAAERIYRATEGNPLFVHEVLRVRGAIAPGNLPDGLRTVIDEHVLRVSAETTAAR
jgi:predicted ATPase